MSPTPVRIVGIDPGINRTGWGVVESLGMRLSFIACGTLRSRADAAVEARLADIFDGLVAVFDRFAPDAASIEETYVNADPQSAMRLSLARGVAMLVPGLKGVPVSEYAPATVKKSVTGSGAADKRQVQAMVSLLLPKAVFDGADSADALALAITHVNARPSLALRMALAR